MRGTVARRVSGAVLFLFLLALVIAGCGAPSEDSEQLPLPTFAAPEPDPTTLPTEEPAGRRLPADCARLLPAADLGALLALPLDSVAVRGTVGVPAPSVGRTERLTCRYREIGGAALLELDVGAYTEAEAARVQWRRNADAEDGERRDLAFGSAPGMLISRPARAVLTVVNGSETVTLVLPDRIRPGGQRAAETLTDLALRILPRVSPTTPGRADEHAAGGRRPRPFLTAPS